MIKLLSETLGAKGWLKWWSIFILAFPFYFFSAGSAQPADIYIAALIVLYALGGNLKYDRQFRTIIKKFGWLVAYICVVNIILAIVRIGYAHDKGLPWYIVNAFYVYNFIIFIFCISLFGKYGVKFLYTTVYAIVLSAIMQVVLSPIGHKEGSRAILFFTNPNQLGYYAVSALTVVLALERVIKIKRSIIFLSFILFFYFSMICLSKAALGSMVILLAVYMLTNKILSLESILKIGIVVAGLFITLMYTNFGSTFITALNDRFENSVKPDEVSEWQYRGYDRITNHPEYLVLGSGEGAYNRFDTYIDDHEIHSSIGTIIFAYGIPGTILFFSFIFSLLKGLPKNYIAYMMPLIAYGVTHMGLRFTIFWITLAMFPVARGGFTKRKTEMATLLTLQKRRGLASLQG